jgi:chromosome segregation ATPase
MNFLRTAYSKLQEKMQAQTHALESTEQQLSKAYNSINLLERGMTDLEKKESEFRGARYILRKELKIARKEVYKSHANIENLKNSS